jgi:spermidine synthase
VPGWLLPLLFLLFFCSGGCALVYQVMWLRLLALVFGVTVYAASTVLASFMGGLAVGSYAAGRFAGRLRSPLRAFGLVEIGVGLSALATPLVLDVIKSVWVALNPSLPSSLAFLTVARFVAAFAVLILPTTLMGATLPIVMRSALARQVAAGSRMGLLYAVNTTGAIVGALVAGFYLVPDVGVSRSFWIAASINVAIGLTAVAASTRLQPEPRDSGMPEEGAGPRSSAEAGDDGRTSVTPMLTETQGRAVLVTFVLSGVLSLALEIVWFRMLVTLLRPTAYAFTIMLASVLAGIALGSAIAAPLLRRRLRWLEILTITQLAIAATAVLSLNALDHFEAANASLAPQLVGLGLNAYLAPIIVASLAAMLPTTLLLGFAFPVGLSLWAGREGSPRRIGVFYSLNVCGAIAGSILGGFVFLPLLGSRGSLIASASLALLSSIVLAVSQWKHRPNFAGFTAIVGPVIFAMCALNAANPFEIVERAEHRNDRVLWREEGVQTTVAVHEQRGRSAQRSMLLDGMHQASDLPQMAFVHHRIGAMPVMLHRDPKDALVVGLGGGATAGAVARFPGIHVDVVELSSAVVRGADFFKHVNFSLLQRPNVSLRVDDGRNYLLTTRKKYDVITADIILPRHAGAGALYSREYFQLVRNALNDDGLVLQWNGAEADTTYRLILRTFQSVFPETTLWADGTLMVGSLKPQAFSRAAYERRYADPRFRELFDWTFDTIAKTYLAGPKDVAAWVGPGPILTDDRPTIEYFLSLPQNERPSDLGMLVRRPEEIVRP